MIDRQDRFGLVAADGLGEISSQLKTFLDEPVGVIEELHDRHADRGAAAPLLTVWTSSQTRALPASFNPATQNLTAEVAASDSLLDAIAFSRGRFGVSVSGAGVMVVPTWAEVARVVENCRV
jgi:hypothetical protein